MTKTLYLVDYDIPVYNRFRFYYSLRAALARYLRSEKKFKSLEEAWEYAAAGGVYVRSTQSVIITNERGVAEIVYNIAKKYGEANMYRAEPISPPRYSDEFWEFKKWREEQKKFDEELLAAMRYAKPSDAYSPSTTCTTRGDTR